MAEPRKVPFVTLSAFTAADPSTRPEVTKRLPDAEDTPTVGHKLELGDTKAAGGDETSGLSDTVRININLTENTERSFPEFNYSELLQAHRSFPDAPQTLLHSDLSNREQTHKRKVENLARKFKDRYDSSCRKHIDRLQDLIDIGFGYDESDSFIDNSEAYDELVPASLTTKLGGFYINTGTLQFRNTSDSDSIELEKPDIGRHDEESEMMMKKRRRRRRRDEVELEDKMENNQLTKIGVCHPEKKRRKLMLASMLKHFTQKKKETCKLKVTNSTHDLHTDTLLSDLTSDPAMMSLLTSANESELRDLLNEMDFSILDADPLRNGLIVTGAGLMDGACVNRGVELACPPPLPEGLPAALMKRIEDLRTASRQFDDEGRKKFFTLDMNNILLDIELQVQEQPPSVRATVYSHIEAFVPCSKEALLKRLKKLSLNIQDDRLRAPLLQLKLAVCSVMPEQTARYNMDCMAKVSAKQQGEDGERNVSEDEEEEKPGKRVMGPRKKFIWDDRLRTLLCNLVRVKLKCYEQEESSLSVEDYLKTFMENEVKPLWPKGWMQARMLFKESRTVHGHLTDLGKKKIMSMPKSAKIKEPGWHLGEVTGLSPAPSSCHLPSETICLSDSLDDDLATNSLDSIARALTLLNNSTNGVNPDYARTTSIVVAKSNPHTASPASSAQSSILKDVSSLQRLKDTPARKPATKPRPPPTTTPLQKPFGTIGVKSGNVLPPAGQLKNSLYKLVDGGVKQPTLNSRSFQQVTTLPSPSSPLIQKKATPMVQRFITPMQATITKSSQSSNSPIIKLTPRPPAHTTSTGSAHHPPAPTTPAGSAHRPSAQTTPAGSVHHPPVQTTPAGSAHRLPAQTTPAGSGTATRPPLQITPSISAHRPPVQTSSGSSHRLPAQTMISGSDQYSTAQTQLLVSTHRPASQATPLGSSHNSPIRTTPPGSAQHAVVQSIASTLVHQPRVQMVLSGSTQHPAVSKTSPPSTAHAPTITTPTSPHSNHPSPANCNNIGPATLPESGSIHRPMVSTPPSPGSHRSSAQTALISTYHPSGPTPPPTLSRRSPSATPTSVSSPVPTPPTQYSSKSSGFKPLFSHATIATPHTSSFQDCNLTSSSVTANHEARQRVVGGANCAMGLPSLSDSTLLNQVSSLPLGLGMFGGLVPVSLPFQLPLLNFTPPGAATHPPSSGYTMTQNLLKSLQSSVAALPPHLQLAFAESNQSQGGDVKRK